MLYNIQLVQFNSVLQYNRITSSGLRDINNLVKNTFTIRILFSEYRNDGYFDSSTVCLFYVIVFVVYFERFRIQER